MMDSKAALKAGYPDLSRWLGTAEKLWDDYGPKTMSFQQQCDYFGKLSAQFPIARCRVLIAASGTQPAAAKLTDETRGLAEHALYWTSCSSIQEADYLCAVLNSETSRSRVEQWQAEGQWGKRHFDKAMFNLPIPQFDPKNELHKELAAAAMHAEFVASRVDVKEGEYFVTTRNRIRKTLAEEGIAEDIDKLVEKLLGPA